MERERGNALLSQGDLKGAIEAYRTSLSQNEADRHLSLSNLSLALLQSKEPKASLEAAQLCQACAPPSFQAKSFIRAALAYAHLGDLQHVRESILSAIKSCTSDEQKQQVQKVMAKCTRIAKTTQSVTYQSSTVTENRSGEETSAVDAMELLRRAQEEVRRAEQAFAEAKQSQKTASEVMNAARKEVASDELEEMNRRQAEFEAATQALVTQLGEIRVENKKIQATENAQENKEKEKPAPKRDPREKIPLYQVMLNASIASDGTTLTIEWECFGPVGEKREGCEEDFIGLYRIEELDAEEYWNMEAGVGERGSRGQAEMRRPTKPGIYEFRYIAKSPDRCAGRSQPVIVGQSGTFVGSIDPIKFLLIMDPNLLAYTLYVPLSTRAPVDLGKTKLPAFAMTNSPDPRVPTMTSRDEKRTVRILAPRRNPAMHGMQGDFSDDPKIDRHLVPYLDVYIGEPVDVDRSTLSLQGGDFLAARLAFANGFSSSIAKRKRAALHPQPEELDPAVYKGGLGCKACGNQLTGSFNRVNQASYTPWVEMLEHLTCVPPEDYRGGETSKAFKGEALGPSPGCIMLDQAFFDITGHDIEPNSMRLNTQVDAEIPPDDPRATPNLVMRYIDCNCCGAFVGLAQEDKNYRSTTSSSVLAMDDEQGKSRFGMVRLFKHCVCLQSSKALLDPYDASGTFFGSQLARLAEIREIRQVTVYTRSESGNEWEGFVVNLWTSESWARDHAHEEMYPILKVSYQPAPVEGLDRSGGIIATRAQFNTLKADLETSTAAFPPSARQFDDALVGFLRW